MNHLIQIQPQKMKYQKKQKTFSPRKFRSGLEKEIASQLCQQRIKFEYETLTVKYSKPTSKYTPDFILPNGIIIEAKGQFVSSDRSKHKLIKEQHPDLDIRFVLATQEQESERKAKQLMPCGDRFGFNFSDVSIPVHG